MEIAEFIIIALLLFLIIAIFIINGTGISNQSFILEKIAELKKEIKEQKEK